MRNQCLSILLGFVASRPASTLRIHRWASDNSPVETPNFSPVPSGATRANDTDACPRGPGDTLELLPLDNPTPSPPPRQPVRAAPPIPSLGDSTVAVHRDCPLHVDDILATAVHNRASDIHLTVGLPPMGRKDGKLEPLFPGVLEELDTQRLVYDILRPEQLERFERTRDIDFAYEVAGVGRFRCNVFRQRARVGMAARTIATDVPTLESLAMPAVLAEITTKHSGIVLVTGQTGSGKSTTIAAMIDAINRTQPVHILTLEDPVEFIHPHKRAMVNQREIGHDSQSFESAIRAALREDPDVILVGEMRDRETIAAALTLAETRHLVFGTLHTRSAPATVDRIVDAFPADQQEQIRVQLAGSVQAIVAQQLVPKRGGGRIAALEIMVGTSAVRNLIREGKTHQLGGVIETGLQFGMQSMDKTLAEMVRTQRIELEHALRRAADPETVQRLLRNAA